MRRVLAPEGIAGIRDPDPRTEAHAPSDPVLDEQTALVWRAFAHNGASTDYARQQRRLLLEAGFARSEGTAAAIGHGSPVATRWVANLLINRLNGGPAQTAVFQGWTTPERVQEMSDVIRSWGERFDAFYAILYCTAIGWASS
jgi:hypothetical protein